MLDAFIIDEVRRREKERNQAEDDRRPRLELPLHRDPGGDERNEEEVCEDDNDSVVVINV
jgi:hypothetical protein